MRLSKWRATPPTPEAVTPRVDTILEPALAMLGPAGPGFVDRVGEDPATRLVLKPKAQHPMVGLEPESLWALVTAVLAAVDGRPPTDAAGEAAA